MIFNVARYKTMRAMVLNKPRTPGEPGRLDVEVLLGPLDRGLGRL
jgi:hypothetical protein